MDRKDKIDLETEYYASDFQRHSNIVDIPTYLQMKQKCIDDIVDSGDEIAWIEEIRRFYAIKELLLNGKCTYSDDCKIDDKKEKPVSFQRKTLRDPLLETKPKKGDDRPTRPIDTRLVSV